jgi:hypothetical protein
VRKDQDEVKVAESTSVESSMNTDKTYPMVHSMEFSNESGWVASVPARECGTLEEEIAYLTEKQGYVLLRSVLTMTSPDGRQVEMIVMHREALR